MPRGRTKAPQQTRDTSVSTTTTKNRPTSEQPRTTYPPAVPPPPVSPVVAQLRKDFRWASISQFLFSFGHALGVSDEEGDVDALERDLEAERDDELVPRLVVKLLYALTYDKKINMENLELKLRKQYVLRDPRRNPFGNDEQVSKRWNQLDLNEKIEAFYNCCEWLWDDPARFRALLNSEDDAVQWRIEPCGWDKGGNTYWLFDDNRLWVQHPPPTPVNPPTPAKQPPKKAKATNNDRRKKGYVSPSEDEEQAEPQRAGRKARYKPVRHAVEEETSDAEQLDEEPPRKRGRMAPVKTTTTRYGRTSKAVQEPSVGTTRGKRIKLYEPEPEPAPTGGRSTRASQRSGIVGDQWEPIPDEWLNPDTVGKATGGKGKGKKGKKPTREEEEESELSELSDVEGEEESDLTSISSSGLSDVDGDDVPVVEETQAASFELGKGESVGGEGVQSTETVPMETEKEESLVAAPVDKADDQTPMDIDQLVAVLPSDSQPPVDDTTDGPDPAADPANNVSVDLSSASQENAIVSSTTKEEQALVAEQSGDDVSMEAVEPKDAGQTVGGGEMAVESGEVAVDGVQSAAAQAERSAPISAEDQPSSLKKEAESLLPPQQESPTDGPSNDIASDQKTNGDEGKTVLQELSEEVAQALEEEEDDPNDEVRAIIKRARNPDYLEWELVCASRYEWEQFPRHFENSRNPDERAFYRHLVNNILPGVLAAHREKEIRRAQEEAVRNRKRSSRLVMKELEREAQQKEEERIRQLEERMQRVRDEEARREAEERERFNRERGREERLREREERIREREERLRYRELEDLLSRERSEREPDTRLRRRDLGLGGSMSRQGSRQSSELPARELRTRGRKREASPEDWEVACEICNRHGWNIDEDRRIVSCELCERWQHIDCHDRFDKQQGRPPRKWSTIDFYCTECRQRLAEGRTRVAAEVHYTNGDIHAPLKSPDSAMKANGEGPSTSPLVHRSPRITIPAYAHGRSPVLQKAQPQLLPPSGASGLVQEALTSHGPPLSPPRSNPFGDNLAIPDSTSATIAATVEPSVSQLSEPSSFTPLPSQTAVEPPEHTAGLTNNHHETSSAAQYLPVVVAHDPAPFSMAVEEAGYGTKGEVSQELERSRANAGLTSL